jgi:hypothetical protein
MVHQGGAAGLPPLFAETLLGSPMKAEFPAGASANRAAIPAPNRSVLPKKMVQSEGGQVFPAIDFPPNSIYLSVICNRFAKGGVNHILLEEEVERWAGNFLYFG